MGSTTNNGYVPNIQAQLSYLIQWFHEWSEMQRSDFLPILSQKFGSKSYVNGLLPGMEGITNWEEKPPSLFQCRIKLFREWSDTWTQADKDQLLSHIRSMDPEFMQKYEDEINSTVKPTTQEVNETSNLQSGNTKRFSQLTHYTCNMPTTARPIQHQTVDSDSENDSPSGLMIKSDVVKSEQISWFLDIPK